MSRGLRLLASSSFLMAEERSPASDAGPGAAESPALSSDLHLTRQAERSCRWKQKEGAVKITGTKWSVLRLGSAYISLQNKSPGSLKRLVL